MTTKFTAAYGRASGSRLQTLALINTLVQQKQKQKLDEAISKKQSESPKPRTKTGQTEQTKLSIGEKLDKVVKSPHYSGVIRPGSAARVLAVVVAIASGAVIADPAPHSEIANQIVFVGLLPLKKQHGAGELVAVKDAQSIRTVAEAALVEVWHQPVVGHEGLSDLLGAAYVPPWFACRSDITCLGRVLAPVRQAGYRRAITGEYYVAKDGTYHVRLVLFSITDGTVTKEIEFELAPADVKDQQRWVESLRPLVDGLLGRVRIASNVAGFTCMIDGEACTFEPDGQTIAATPGEHAIELRKDDHEPEKVVVNVVAGGTRDVTIALEAKKSNTDGRKVAVAGAGRRAPTLTAVRTEKAIDIDGKFDDPAWQKARIETNFTQNFPDEAKPPTERTELRVLYDDDAIYIGIRCYDSHPDEIVSRLTRRDRDIEGDKVTVDVSSRNDHATAYHFQVSAANVQVDGTRFNDTDFSTDWDGVWYSKTSRDDKGWTAELKIPLGALRYTGDSTSFGFQVRRNLQRREEIDEWSYVPRNAQGEVSYYGTLDGLIGLKATRLLQLTPYESRDVTFRSKQPIENTTFGNRVGGDVKLGLTPALTLDGTVNPDFSTVEVDQVVLNLSTVETYFPEKRPFFLEGADLFSTPFELFYSRRVGRTPPPTGVSGIPAEPPPQGQILAATKVTGLLASRFSIGLLDAVTSREDATIARMPGATPENVLVDPLTNFGVLRLRQEFGTNSSIGLMATSVTRMEPEGLAAPMPADLCPRPHGGINQVGTQLDQLVTLAPSANGRCTNDAYTGGVDTVVRTADGTWRVFGQFVGSILENGPPRVVPDGTVINPGDVGWGVQGEAGKYGGEHLLFRVYYQFLNPKLELNDAGYMDTVNSQAIVPFLTWRSTTPVMGLLNTSLTLQSNYMYTADGTRAPQARGEFVQWLATFPNFWTVSVRSGAFLAHYDERETRDGALFEGPARYNYLATATAKTDPREPVIVTLQSSVGRTLRGATASGTLTVNLRPASFLELDVISDGSWSFGDPRWVDTELNADMSRTYLFQDLDSRSWDVLLRGTYTFSPSLSLQTYVQLYLDSGHYGRATSAMGSGPHPRLDIDDFTTVTLPGGIDDEDFRDSALNVNAFLRWEYLPGSALWLVYTRHQINLPYDPSEGIGRLRFDQIGGASTDVILVKLSYLWEPLLRH